MIDFTTESLQSYFRMCVFAKKRIEIQIETDYHLIRILQMYSRSGYLDNLRIHHKLLEIKKRHVYRLQLNKKNISSTQWILLDDSAAQKIVEYNQMLCREMIV